jgi:ubiquinone/menaquinone biosynthesis C-methylase UbiE
MSTTNSVSSALDRMFERPGGLYGGFEDLPIITQTGHYRRMELLDKLEIGDVSGFTCLDFGMGSWGFAPTFPRLHSCRRAIGMDISRSALDQTLRVVNESNHGYAKDFTVHQSDGMNIPLPDESVDLLYSGESIEHTRFPWLFLSEAYRVLKPNGQIIVTTPNREPVVYKSVSEEYCTSPEHFWLFNYAEVAAAISEFFDIKEKYGFNLTVGPELDKAFTNKLLAERWSAAFQDQPELSSSLIFRGRKKDKIKHRYSIVDIPSSAVKLPKSAKHLDLEFGLKGVLLDSPDKKVTILRPPSDGIVCRLWCHKWSGHAEIKTAMGREIFDLYTMIPGWKNWKCDRATTSPEEITISYTGNKNVLAENAEVLFFEAFTYRKNLV